MEESLRSIFGFPYVTNMDMYMEYTSMLLDEPLRNILTLIIPIGLLECLVLPQGTPQLWKSKVKCCLFKNICPNDPPKYLDDILHTKGGTFQEHLAILDEILTGLEKAEVQVNAEVFILCN